jgi:curved DNA-binding protein CbpA
MEVHDYYDFLQISPKAEAATIQRIYRFLAARLHPDNPETGSGEKFLLLKQAYDTLSDPARRAEYDATYKKQAPQLVPLSTSIDFMDDIDGELNRRLAVLAVLYIHRRKNPYIPEVSLAEVEMRMGFPRDYLHFTLWYLRTKNYLTQNDSSDFTLTAPGVDFVEQNRVHVPALDKLLKGYPGPSPTDKATGAKALPLPRQPLIVSEVKSLSEGTGAMGG